MYIVYELVNILLYGYTYDIYLYYMLYILYESEFKII